MIPAAHPFWQGCARGVLAYQRCGACDAAQAHARPFCVRCLSPDLAWREAAGGGTLAALTTVHRAPDEAFRALVPYRIALVDADEGFRFMALADPGPAIGDRVALDVRPVAGNAFPWVRAAR